MKRKIFRIVIIVFLAIQLVQTHGNKSAETSPHDITKLYNTPAPVLQILQRSCYDCHSNNTRYPWYTYIQPIGWWITLHIQQGKDGLNFSEYGKMTKEDQGEVFGQIYKSIDEDWMPLESYLWIHGDSKLSVGESKLLLEWAEKNCGELVMCNE